jgi:hypothetical protein
MLAALLVPAVRLIVPPPRFTPPVPTAMFPEPVLTVNVAGVPDSVRAGAPCDTVMLPDTVFTVGAVDPNVSANVPVAAAVLVVAVPDIVPVPVAVSVTLVPDKVELPINILELVSVSTSDIAPLEVSPVVVMPVPDDPLSVNVTVPGLLVVLLMEVLAVSVMNTVPAVFIDMVGALVSMLAIPVPTVPAPDPVTRDNVPAVEILVAAC